MALGGKQLTKPNFSHGFSISPVTATAASNAASADGELVVITSESLTTAAGAEYTCTLTNPSIAADSVIFASAGLASSTAGTPGIGGVTVSAGSAVITVTNLHSANAFNGTIQINVLVLNSAY